MPQRVRAEARERFDCAPDTVRAAARDALGARHDGESLVCVLDGGARPDVAVRIEVAPDGTGATARMHTEFDAHIPYFGWAIVPVLRAATRRAVAATAARLRAHIEQRPAPRTARTVPFSPPVAFSPEQATFLATVAMATAVAAFGASLASQNVHFVGEAFGATDEALGVALAASRAGALIGLVATAMADRRGRRRLLLVAICGICAGSAVSAMAPNLAAFASGQVLVRGFSNAAFAIGGIAAVEEAPDGARAYTVSMLALASGLGYAPGLALVSIGDLHPSAWRIAFALSAASVAFVPGIGRRLTETARYAALAARAAARGRVREVFDDVYGSRFAILVATSFLGAVFGAPGAQFQNRYLAEVRGFAGWQITVFVAATGAPGFLGLLLGGRLAETYGRKPVATWTLLATTVLQMLFFVTAGPAMWVVSVASSIAGGMLAPVLGALGAELFATEIRGTANGMLIVAGVAGAATGLVGAGWLAIHVGGLGNAVALTGIAALLVVPLVPRLPESAFRALEDVSPSEV